MWDSTTCTAMRIKLLKGGYSEGRLKRIPTKRDRARDRERERNREGRREKEEAEGIVSRETDRMYST